MNILFLTRYNHLGPSSRFRVFQYEPLLKKSGMETFIFPVSLDNYSAANRLFERLKQIKLYKVMSELFWLKIVELVKEKQPDIIFIQKVPFTPYELRVIKKLTKKLIYDLDDAIFIKQPEWKPSGKELYEFQRRQEYFGKMLSEYNHIIVGNEFLKQYVIKFNSNVTVIPTPIDTDKFKPLIKINSSHLIIGWIGTSTNLPYLNNIKDALKKLCVKYSNVRLKIVSNDFIDFNESWVDKKRWKLEDEASDIQSFDIGIMPLSDNDWARGKCGFKILQYMGAGIPIICSPVGINKEIIKDGVNGFLADTLDDWYNKLSELIKNRYLRETFSKAGLSTVERKYSLKKIFPVFYETIKRVLYV